MDKASSVLVPDDICLQSPSLSDGVSNVLETSHRIFGCNLVQHGGMLLKCPQVVMVTAQNIFHRFYYRFKLLWKFSYFI